MAKIKKIPAKIIRYKIYFEDLNLPQRLFYVDAYTYNDAIRPIRKVLNAHNYRIWTWDFESSNGRDQRVYYCKRANKCIPTKYRNHKMFSRFVDVTQYKNSPMFNFFFTRISVTKIKVKRHKPVDIQTTSS